MSDLYRYNMGDPSFGNIHFAGTLRPSQVAASSVIREQLDKGTHFIKSIISEQMN